MTDFLIGLSDNLNKELSWRKKEFLNMKNLISSVENLDEANFLFRGSIALTYAHWEGGIKNLLEQYKTFLNKYLQSENVKNITEEWLLDLIFKDTIRSLGQNTKEKRIKVVNEFRNYFENNSMKITFDISTKSNLNFIIFKNLLIDFNISIKDEVELKEKFINTLVRNRNYIAHGENKFATRNKEDLKSNKEIIKDGIEKIIELLEVVSIQIEENAKIYCKITK